MRTKRGKPIDKGYLYKLLNNRVYIGEAVHKGTAYPGEHEAIIDRDLWDKVHAILPESPRKRAAQHPGADAGAAEGADLRADRRGHVADPHPQGRQALPLLRQPGGAEARAGCLPGRARAGGGDRGGGHRPAARHLPAAGDRRRHLAGGAGEQDDITEAEAREALLQLDPLWDELFPAEQARIVQLLVERVDVRMHGVEVRLRPNGLAGLVREVAGSRRAAA